MPASEYGFRRLFRNIISSAGLRALNLAISLAVVPLTVGTLPAREYGLLAAAISFSALVNYADLGIGHVIVNRIAGRSGAVPRRAISCAWVILVSLASIGLIVAGLFKLIAPALFAVERLPLLQSALSAACFVLLGIPAGLGQRVLYASGRTHEANVWQLVGKLASFAGVYIIAKIRTPSLSAFLFCILAIPGLIGWLQTYFSVFRDVRFAPKLRLFRARLLRFYLSRGFAFAAIQLVPYAEVGIDGLLVGWLVGLEAVPALDVHNRLFAYIPALLSIAMLPLWPAVAQARLNSDDEWIGSVYKYGYITIALTSAILAIGLVGLSGTMIHAWTGAALSLPRITKIGIGICAMIGSVSLFQAMLLNGLGRINEQASMYLIYAPILVMLKISAGYAMGVNGIVWTLVLCAGVRLMLAHRLLRSNVSSKGMIRAASA